MLVVQVDLIINLKRKKGDILMTIYAITQVSINANDVHNTRYMSFYEHKTSAEKALATMEAEERSDAEVCGATVVSHSDYHSFTVDFYNNDTLDKIIERKIYSIENVLVH